MTVAELLARISSKELTQWMIFSQREPFGSEADLLGHAIVAATIANVNRKKGTKPYTAADFLPKFEQRKAQTVDEMIGMAAQSTIMFGGKDLR